MTNAIYNYRYIWLIVFQAGRYSRIPMPASMIGPDYGGYSITNLNGDLVVNDQFVPAPRESELSYIFSHPPDQTLYWSLPVFPGEFIQWIHYLYQEIILHYMCCNIRTYSKR